MRKGLLPSQREIVIYHAKLPPTPKSVALYLATHAIDKDRVWPSVPTVAARIGRSPKTVRRAITWLCRNGYLKFLHQTKTPEGLDSSNCYLILFEKFIENYEQQQPNPPVGLDTVTTKRGTLFPSPDAVATASSGFASEPPPVAAPPSESPALSHSGLEGGDWDRDETQTPTESAPLGSSASQSVACGNRTDQPGLHGSGSLARSGYLPPLSAEEESKLRARIPRTFPKPKREPTLRKLEEEQRLARLRVTKIYVPNGPVRPAGHAHHRR